MTKDTLLISQIHGACVDSGATLAEERSVRQSLDVPALGTYPYLN